MRILAWWMTLLGAVLLAVSGCGKQADVKAEVSELEKAFPTTGGVGGVQTGKPAAESALPAEATAYVTLALAAIRAHDYAGGVVALQTAQKMPKVTAEQLMTLQGVVRAITADLVARAAKGDAQAQAQLAAIESSRSQ